MMYNNNNNDNDNNNNNDNNNYNCNNDDNNNDNDNANDILHWCHMSVMAFHITRNFTVCSTAIISVRITGHLSGETASDLWILLK